MPARVGFIGCGHARNYMAAFGRIDDCVPVALCAPPDDPRRAEAAKAYAIPRAYDTAGAMLGREKLDLVVVGSPPRWHKEHTCLALEAGAAVLCEKPPCMNAAEAAACYFRALFTGPHLEWGLCYRQARGLPPPRPHLSAVHARWHRTAPPAAPWAADVATAGGGVLADLGCHMLDLALYALGDPPLRAAQGEMRDAAGRRIAAGAEASFTGVLEAEGGRRISLDLSWAARAGAQELSCFGDPAHAPAHAGKVEDRYQVAPDDEIYLRTAHQFVAHVYAANRARQLEITARGVALQRAIDALYRSAAIGHGVALG